MRQQANRLRREGKSFTRIGEYLGVYRNTMSRWRQEYQETGEAALVQQRRGQKLGEGRTLSEAQEAAVQEQMRLDFPEEVGIESAFWTGRAVSKLDPAAQWGSERDLVGWRVSQTMGLLSIRLLLMPLLKMCSLELPG